jgi:hypothetical protein
VLAREGLQGGKSMRAQEYEQSVLTNDILHNIVCTSTVLKQEQGT